MMKFLKIIRENILGIIGVSFLLQLLFEEGIGLPKELMIIWWSFLLGIILWDWVKFIKKKK
jgi:hypothetical protein